MRSTSKEWLIPAGLIALSLVPAIYGTAPVAQLAGGAPQRRARPGLAPGRDAMAATLL
jgi:hypothetical protein